MNLVHLLDEPTFIITIKEDGEPISIQDVSVKQLILKKPDGTKLTKTPDFLTSGSDGKLKYKALPGEIDQTKNWALQAVLQWDDGRFATQIEIFAVQSNL